MYIYIYIKYWYITYVIKTTILGVFCTTIYRVFLLRVEFPAGHPVSLEARSVGATAGDHQLVPSHSRGDTCSRCACSEICERAAVGESIKENHGKPKK